ncbi:NnrS family protein [Marivita sp. GX14005]|uniref:NnrS family protein n=1 Tax=Marivita sp. GX14005 TaxID=2942276 RepID=UPI00201946C6|nr:NnrS family protein [Marivita sp. GX14005]MCL3883039.1 NnrS family protein [Marivita sp. GX14005]
MSCSSCSSRSRPWPASRLGMLGDEGFRLFFPLGAVYAAFFPLFWVLAMGFDLPLTETVPPALWHAHEMLIGAFGAALIGFLTTAAPEWTDTEPMRGWPLWALAALWGAGRAVGLLGWDGLGAVGALADLVWIAALLVYLLRLSWLKHTDRLLVFALWLAMLLACTAAARFGFVAGDIALAQHALHLAGFAFLGLLGLALARITVPVTNLVLDPTENDSPFRPHPGRLNLAPGLVLVAMAGQVSGLSPAVNGYLLLAAGAAFMDRVAEAFIGRAALRSEIVMLAGASALAGTGLMMTGAAELGAQWPAVTGLHVAFMGGLGLGVYAVFCIAGLLHTGRGLGLSLTVRAGALALGVSVLLRIAPDLGIALPGPLHAAAALLWAGGFGAWLSVFWRYMLAAPMDAPQTAPADAPHADLLAAAE